MSCTGVVRSLKLGNVFVQLIFGPGWSTNQLQRPEPLDKSRDRPLAPSLLLPLDLGTLDTNTWPPGECAGSDETQEALP